METQQEMELVKKMDYMLKKMDELQCCPEIRRFWMPAKELQDFLKYKATRFSSTIESYNLEVLEIGKKKFLSIASIEKMFKINKNNLLTNKN